MKFVLEYQLTDNCTYSMNQVLFIDSEDELSALEYLIEQYEPVLADLIKENKSINRDKLNEVLVFCFVDLKNNEIPLDTFGYFENGKWKEQIQLKELEKFFDAEKIKI